MLDKVKDPEVEMLRKSLEMYTSSPFFKRIEQLLAEKNFIMGLLAQATWKPTFNKKVGLTERYDLNLGIGIVGGELRLAIYRVRKIEGATDIILESADLYEVAKAVKFLYGEENLLVLVQSISTYVTMLVAPNLPGYGYRG